MVSIDYLLSASLVRRYPLNARQKTRSPAAISESCGGIADNELQEVDGIFDSETSIDQIMQRFTRREKFLMRPAWRLSGTENQKIGPESQDGSATLF
jgi:hypothetical protein